MLRRRCMPRESPPTEQTTSSRFRMSAFAPVSRDAGHGRRVLRDGRRLGQRQTVIDRNLTVAATAGLRLMLNGQRPGAALLHKRYAVVSELGQGTFSRIVKCRDLYWPRERFVAVKIHNEDCAYIGQQELLHLLTLNSSSRSVRFCSVVEVLDAFDHGRHVCIVLECLGPSLHMISARRRMPIDRVRKIALRLVGALAFLKNLNVIHADMKPENVLLADAKGQSSKVRIVDFGNAIHPADASAYFDDFNLQSMFYRAPEVLFGMRDFTFPIDMWSLGCIVAELVSGRPLFPAVNPTTLLEQMQDLLGPIPVHLFQDGGLWKFYPVVYDAEAISYEARLERIAQALDIRDPALITFICALLEYDPSRRLTPREAVLHSFFSPIFPFADVMLPSPR
ncbi:Protein kinase domain-containing protein [Plasmodiophora brassicae]